MNELPTIPADYNATLETIAHAAADWLTTLLLIVVAWMIIRRAIRWLVKHQ